MLRAYITVCAERALAAAREAEREIAAGDYRGPLHGLPFGVKDQLCTTAYDDVRLDASCRLRAGL